MRAFKMARRTKFPERSCSMTGPVMLSRRYDSCMSCAEGETRPRRAVNARVALLVKTRPRDHSDRGLRTASLTDSRRQQARLSDL